MILFSQFYFMDLHYNGVAHMEFAVYDSNDTVMNGRQGERSMQFYI